jgi:pyridoxine 5-phosphate synthase
VEAGDAARAEAELKTIQAAAADAAGRGLEVHAGHGISFASVGPIAAIPQLKELNIGHFLVGEAIFTGLAGAIAEMRRRMDAARA